MGHAFRDDFHNDAGVNRFIMEVTFVSGTSEQPSHDYERSYT